jgi:hypothetical protein
MRTFLVLALTAMIAVRAVGRQPTAAENPCIEKGRTNPRLLPVDEASSNPEFSQYRARLRMAVERRDLEAVVAAADTDIRLGFDSSGGRDGLRKAFSEDPTLWDELRVVLALGGRFPMPMAFAAPYVYSAWPGEFDAFECAAVTGANVRVRTAPRLDAPVMTAVTHSIVRLLASSDDGKWAQVQLADRRKGYLWRSYVRSPVYYRALFNLIDGRWRMTAFVAGD